MPRILVSELDKRRDSFDKVAKELVAKMRKNALKWNYIYGDSKEACIKYMPETFEFWVQQHPDFSRKDFEDSQFGQLAQPDWLDPRDKSLAMHRSYQDLRIAEKEMLASWKRSA